MDRETVRARLTETEARIEDGKRLLAENRTRLDRMQKNDRVYAESEATHRHLEHAQALYLATCAQLREDLAALEEPQLQP